MLSLPEISANFFLGPSDSHSLADLCLLKLFIFSLSGERTTKISLSLRKREADSIKTVPLADFNKITADGYVSKLTNDITQIETQGVMSLYRLFLTDG